MNTVRTDPAKLDALGRLLSHRLFPQGQNGTRLLSYIVTEALEGRADKLKAYNIGQDVFGRGPGFDPSNDSIVRVETKRLRETLAHYYATEGASDPVRIEIPKGTYKPSFLEGAPPVAKPVPQRDFGPARDRRGLFLFGLSVAALAAGAAVFTVTTHGAATKPAECGVSCEGAPQVSINAVHPSLLAVESSAYETLSLFHNLHLVDSSGDASGKLTAQYTLVLEAAPGQAPDVISAQVVYRGDRSVLSSRRFAQTEINVGLVAFELTPFRIWLGQNFGRNGVLEKHFMEHDLASGDALCTSLTERYFAEQTDALHLAARDCVATRLAAGFRSSRLYVDYAFLLREEFTDQRNLQPGDALYKALVAARKAVDIDPFDAQGHYALMTVLFLTGSLPEARKAGEMAIALNPFDGETAGGFASRLNLAGDYARAEQLFALAERLTPGTANWRVYGRFLSDYGLGRYDHAASRAMALRGSQNPLYLAALAISFDRRGDAADAARSLAALESQEPDMRDMYLRRNYNAPLTERLLADLARIQAMAAD